METVYVIKEICSSLISNRRDEAFKLAETHMPFESEYKVRNITIENIKLIHQNIISKYDNNYTPDNEIAKQKNYQKYINTVLLRDGFIDRYGKTSFSEV